MPRCAGACEARMQAERGDRFAGAYRLLTRQKAQSKNNLRRCCAGRITRARQTNQAPTDPPQKAETRVQQRGDIMNIRRSAMAIAALVCTGCGTMAADVTPDRLAKAESEPGNW